MIAIFSTKQSANAFSNKIHAFLRSNRERYNAIKWSEENKSANEEKWMVQIHPDIDELDKRFNLGTPENNEHQIVEIIETLPDNWYNNEEI